MTPAESAQVETGFTEFRVAARDDTLLRFVYQPAFPGAAEARKLYALLAFFRFPPALGMTWTAIDTPPTGAVCHTIAVRCRDADLFTWDVICRPEEALQLAEGLNRCGVLVSDRFEVDVTEQG